MRVGAIREALQASVGEPDDTRPRELERATPLRSVTEGQHLGSRLEMAGRRFDFAAEVWLHPGAGGWHFVTLPDTVADAVEAAFGERERPFGRLPVRATVGRTAWATSIFRDTKLGSYLLPVKADVRRAEGIRAAQVVEVGLELV